MLLKLLLRSGAELADAHAIFDGDFDDGVANASRVKVSWTEYAFFSFPFPCLSVDTSERKLELVMSDFEER